MEENNYKFKQNVSKKKYVASIIILILFFSATYLYILKESNVESYRKDASNFIYENLSLQKLSEVKHVYIEPINYASKDSKIQSPVNSGNKTIIIRMDDIAAHQYRGTSEKLIQDILDRNMSITIAVIPNRIYQLHEDKELVSWLNEMKSNPNFEIALHGSEHTFNEFKELNYGEAYESIKEGNKEILTTLGIVPVTFIPPSNEYNYKTLLALKDAGFKIFSAKEDEYYLTEQKDFLSLGYTARTYDFYNTKFIPVEGVIEDCKKSLEEDYYCVVMIHPQDYLQKDDSGEIVNEFDSERYSEFQRMLDELDKLSKEQNAEFKTFKDLIVEG